MYYMRSIRRGGSKLNIYKDMVQWQKTFQICSWCKWLQFKNNYCIYCGHDMRIDWNKKDNVYNEEM
jgi:hypothetical protein